jgi:ribosome-binding factor A
LVFRVSGKIMSHESELIGGNGGNAAKGKASRRVQKVAEAIREVVSMSILTELQDPRVRDVTVTGVEASRDLHYAKVMVSVMGDETRQNLTLRGLQSAAGFLQAKIADRIDLRYTPRLTFVLDQGVKNSIAMAQILRDVLPDEKPGAGEDGPSSEDAADPREAPDAAIPSTGRAGGPADAGSPDDRGRPLDIAGPRPAPGDTGNPPGAPP